MRLPTVYSTPDGFATEGASATLLSELLEELSTELERAEPEPPSLAPGLSQQQVVDALSAAGIPPLEELVIWWTWRDGLAPGAVYSYRNAPQSLERALAFRRFDESRGYMFTSGPEWIGVVGQGSDALVMSTTDAVRELPIVRRLDPETIVAPTPLTSGRGISLCTPVTMWLTAIRMGWETFDPNSRRWMVSDIEEFPLEWRLAQLI